MNPREYSPFEPAPDSLSGVISLADIEALICAPDSIAIGDDLSDGWPTPQGLGEELPPVPPFDSGLLPESMRPLVEDIADRMQVPLDFPAVVAVATLAGLCGRRALIQPKEHDSSWIVVPNLWGAIVANPGMMKSPVIAAVTETARSVEAEWRSDHSAAMNEYMEAQERAKLDMAVWQEKYKRAHKKNDLIPERPKLELVAPSEKRLLATDATFEKLHHLLAQNPAGIFLVRDDLGKKAPKFVPEY